MIELPPRSGSSRPLVVGAIMVSMAMISMETTIVSTAMPQIVAQLGGLALYSWVFSSFLLAQTAMTVVFGKLADVYGRKPIMLVGLAIFLAGSVAAGFAGSMPAMIVFRLIQGAGAGAMLPVALTIIADLYPARERGQVQGYLASVWAVSAVVGPMAGAFIVREFAWGWIFWINVPVGIAAAAGFIAFLQDAPTRGHPAIDFWGAGLFTIAVASLMVFLTNTATAAWLQLVLCGGLFAVSFVLFVFQERRAADPMVSFALWRRREIAGANGAAMVIGMTLMGLTTFLPMYVQAVLHRAPVEAGLALTMVMIGWPAGATFAARSFPRFGLRRIMRAGGLLLPAGASVFLLLAPDRSPVLAAVGSAVMGFGMGLMSVTSLVMIQEIVQTSERGSATASNLFARNLGSTLGASVLGAVLNFGLSSSGQTGIATAGRLRDLLAGHQGSGAIDAAAGAALEYSLHLTFGAMFAISLVSVVFTWLVPDVAMGVPRDAGRTAEANSPDAEARPGRELPGHI